MEDFQRRFEQNGFEERDDRNFLFEDGCFGSLRLGGKTFELCRFEQTGVSAGKTITRRTTPFRSKTISCRTTLF